MAPVKADITKIMNSLRLSYTHLISGVFWTAAEVGVAALQIVAHFVRLHVFLVEDFAYRALHQVGEARMSLGRSTLAGMGGEQPRRPQFVRIAKVLGLATGHKMFEKDALDPKELFLNRSQVAEVDINKVRLSQKVSAITTRAFLSPEHAEKITKKE